MRQVLNYLVRKVLLIDGVLFLLTGLSFVFTRRFSFLALSERLFWVAVAVFMVGGTVAMAQMVAGRALSFPYNVRKPEDAKKFMDETPALHERSERRLDVGIQLWLIGLGCLAFSALVQILFT